VLADAGECGLTPAEAMDCTIRELVAYGNGYRARADEHMRLAMWAVWHGAAFQRARRLPNLKRLLARLGRRRRPLARRPQDLLRMVEGINAVFGGKPLGKSKDRLTWLQ